MGRPRVYRNCKLGQAELDAVLTVSEAATVAGVTSRTIRYHIQRGNINAKDYGRAYGVPISSLIDYYSPPRTYQTPTHAA